MLSAVGPGPLMGLCRQRGGSLSLDSMHIMGLCVCVCVCVYFSACMSVNICRCVLMHVRMFKDTVWLSTVKGWKRKASEESNHLLTARHDWKYAKYNARNRDGYNPLACGMGETLPSILNRKRDWFLWAELNDKITSSDTYNESKA